MKKMFSKDTLTQSAALAAGAIAGSLVFNKLTQIANPKLRAAVPLAVGIFLVGNKNKMLSGLGGGMIAIGGQKLVGSFVPALAGYEADEVIEGVYVDDEGMNEDDEINGTFDTINAYDVINGTDEDFSDND